jgi:large subunit ribosomal protein L17
MRHLLRKKKLNRNTAHRKSLLKNLAFSLLANEQIETTLAKAKFVQSFAESIITIGKKYYNSNDNARKLFLRRFLISKFNSPSTLFINKILDVLSERYKDRNGGYSRIMKYTVRSDSTQMAIIELVDRDINEKGSAKYYNNKNA